MKKVLIITYYWPPAGGPGVQRWLKFVKYLRNYGVEPVVYIPENPEYPIRDKSLQDEVPADIKIIRKKIFEPYSIAGIFSRKDTETFSSGIIKKEKDQSAIQKALLYIRGNYFIPDARKFWIKPSVKFLKEEIEKTQYDVIITTGPPHSLHLIGLKLQRLLGIKWIADFRDPWTQIGYHRKLKLTSSSRLKHEKLEQQVLNAADHILTTSFTTKNEFRSKTRQPVSVITNGFDLDININTTPSKKFRVSHIGSLLEGRNPENLWKALQQLLEENKAFNQQFELRLAGKTSESVLESIKTYKLSDYLVNDGYVSHTKALKLQQEAVVLLLLEIDSVETQGIIPGKVFEYLAAKKPILAIGPDRWDAGRIISETNSGQTFSYGQTHTIKEHIRELFQKWEAGEQLVHSSNIHRYHRKELTSRLAQVIKDL